MEPFFEKFYDKYHNDLYQYVFYMVKNRHVTEDLVQDIYIKVLRSYENFDGKSTEKTWLFSIARHVTIDYFRKQGRTRKRFMEFFNWNDNEEILRDKESLPEELMEKNEQSRRIYHGLDQCTTDQKNVIILRFIQGMSIHETAETLGFSESKVKTTQHRGLKVLKRVLEKEGEVVE
ncbi:RNA polymerase sigma factor SigX [Halobacillus campisalis]|uniref:RNA polymerase sigma factor SigX n=1 Tax=Halobacillus campisalis TaxID=435909 RepID=A0ABW2K3M5_9BACI|nr:RNA polymerase sigma factor SigX [Halobacillus campisalis]